jgi:hypothetical protein
MADETKSPLLILIASALGAMGVVTDATGRLGLPPFWSDVLGIAVFTSLAVASQNALGGKGGEPAVRGFGRQLPAKPQWRNAAVWLTIVLFGGLALWFAWWPATRLVQSSWTVCGTFVPPCAVRNACLQLEDVRHRTTGPSCAAFDDDSGFKRLVGGRWDYRPETAVIKCGNLDKRLTLPVLAFNSTRCDAVMGSE